MLADFEFPPTGKEDTEFCSHPRLHRRGPSAGLEKPYA